MPILDLKDVSQTLEIMRRTRREISEGDARSAIDAQIVQLTSHINAIVAEDERLKDCRNAEQQLLIKKPRDVNWDLLKIGGHVAVMIAKVVAGVAVDKVWEEYLA